MKSTLFFKSFLTLLGSVLLFPIFFGCATPQTQSTETISEERTSTKQATIQRQENRYRAYQCGLSSDKKTPIRCELFGNGPVGKTVLFIGSMVGNEPAGTTLLEELSLFFQQNPDLTEDRKMLLVPSLNPYGVEKGVRENANGVYINGNFSSEFPESETLLIKKLIYQYSPQLIVSIRQLNGIDPDGPPAQSKKIAEEIARFCDLQVHDEQTSKGSLGHYAGDKNGIPVITFGLPRDADQYDPQRLCSLYIKPLIAAAVYPTDLASLQIREPDCLTPLATEIKESMRESERTGVNSPPTRTYEDRSSAGQDRETAVYSKMDDPAENKQKTASPDSMERARTAEAKPLQTPEEEAAPKPGPETSPTEPPPQPEKPAASTPQPEPQKPLIHTAGRIEEALQKYSEGLYEEAIRILQKAYDADPACEKCVEYIEKCQRTASLREQGIKDLDEGRFEEAVRTLSTVISLNPQDPTANERLVQARHDWAVDLFKQGEYKHARELFQSVQAGPDGCPDCKVYLDRIEKKMVEAQEKKIEGWLSQAIEHYEAARYREAIETLEQVTALEPNNETAGEYLSKSHFRLAVASCKKKDPASTQHLTASHRYQNCQSCKTMEAAFKADHFKKGQKAFYNDNYAEAIADWELVRCLDPDYPEVKANIEAARKILEMIQPATRN